MGSWPCMDRQSPLGSPPQTWGARPHRTCVHPQAAPQPRVPECWLQDFKGSALPIVTICRVLPLKLPSLCVNICQQMWGFWGCGVMGAGLHSFLWADSVSPPSARTGDLCSGRHTSHPCHSDKTGQRAPRVFPTEEEYLRCYELRDLCHSSSVWPENTYRWGINEQGWLSSTKL